MTALRQQSSALARKYSALLGDCLCNRRSRPLIQIVGASHSYRKRVWANLHLLRTAISFCSVHAAYRHLIEVTLNLLFRSAELPQLVLDLLNSGKRLERSIARFVRNCNRACAGGPVPTTLFWS